MHCGAIYPAVSSINADLSAGGRENTVALLSVVLMVPACILVSFFNVIYFYIPCIRLLEFLCKRCTDVFSLNKDVCVLTAKGGSAATNYGRLISALLSSVVTRTYTLAGLK